jgi:hypothetical protein
VPRAAPAIGAGNWLRSLNDILAAVPRIAIVTVHRYPYLACVPPRSRAYPSIRKLLSSEASVGLADTVTPLVAIAHKHRHPLRIGETNAIGCGIVPGLSDTFAMALWTVDALFADLKAGVDGVNLHTYPGAPYELFSISQAGGRWSAVVEPEYYGILMFANAAPPGSRLLRVPRGAGPVRVWATRGQSGTIRIVLLNDSTERAHTVTVRVPGAYGPGLLARLRAPTARSTAGVSLGDQSFGSSTDTGRLPGPVHTVTIARSARGYVVAIPPASAGLMTVYLVRSPARSRGP